MSANLIGMVESFSVLLFLQIRIMLQFGDELNLKLCPCGDELTTEWRKLEHFFLLTFEDGNEVSRMHGHHYFHRCNRAQANQYFSERF